MADLHIAGQYTIAHKEHEVIPLSDRPKFKAALVVRAFFGKDLAARSE